MPTNKVYTAKPHKILQNMIIQKSQTFFTKKHIKLRGMIWVQLFKVSVLYKVSNSWYNALFCH